RLPGRHLQRGLRRDVRAGGLHPEHHDLRGDLSGRERNPHEVAVRDYGRTTTFPLTMELMSPSMWLQPVMLGSSTCQKDGRAELGVPASRVWKISGLVVPSWFCTVMPTTANRGVPKLL